METIKVHVCRQKGRTNLAMRYVDPETGKQVWRTAGTANQTKALKAAAVWEVELRDGRYHKQQRISWHDFRDQFERDYLDGLKLKSYKAYSATFNKFERMCRPGRLSELTTARITGFVTMLRGDDLTAATIDRHLRTLKVATRWAVRQGMMAKAPEFAKIKVPKGMKGRPISLEEFERMLAKAGPMEFYLNGLWASGLRLGESLSLRWDAAPEALVVDMRGRRPMLYIPSESEKGNSNRVLPLSPEFAELLATVPERERRGFVFKFPQYQKRSIDYIGMVVSQIGRSAGVVVRQSIKQGDDGKPVTVNKCASAHDLRRSFGFRWSRRVMPTVLRELMRHESIETTLRYYVGVNAESTADTLWEVHDRLNAEQGSKSGSIDEKIAGNPVISEVIGG